MAEEPHRPERRQGTALVIVGVVVILVSCLAFVPLVSCPFHETKQLEEADVNDKIIVGTLVIKGGEVVAGSCFCCGTTERISLLQAIDSASAVDDWLLT